MSKADPTEDRGGKKIKGINASGNHIDEADELEYEMFIQATSRKGRRNEAGQPSISIVTMNPNDGWAKELYYDRWQAGTLPANIRVIEFEPFRQLVVTTRHRSPDDKPRLVGSALHDEQLELQR